LSSNQASGFQILRNIIAGPEVHLVGCLTLLASYLTLSGTVVSKAARHGAGDRTVRFTGVMIPVFFPAE
jgi:hypothetical protein